MNAKAIYTRQALSRAIRLQSVVRTLLGFLTLLGVLSLAAAAQAQNAAQLIGGSINSFAGSTDPNAPVTFDDVQANTSRIGRRRALWYWMLPVTFISPTVPGTLPACQ